MRKIVTSIFLSIFLPFTLNALTFITKEMSNYNLIFANGKIGRGDLYRLQQSYYSLTNRAKQTIIVFNSSGGELNEGLKIGKFLLNHHIGSAVMPEGICASSCALAYLGGRDKYGRKLYILPRNAKLGFHNFYYKNRTLVNATQFEQDLSNVMEYFAAVNAPQYIITKMFKTKYNHIYWVRRSSSLLPFRSLNVSLRPTYKAKRYFSAVEEKTLTMSAFSYIKSYFYQVNLAIQSSRSFYRNNVALNDRNYDYWLATHLNYVYVQKLKKYPRNRFEAKVIYSLKNGTRACAINTYYLGKNNYSWYIKGKKVSPCDRSSYYKIRSLTYRLP